MASRGSRRSKGDRLSLFYTSHNWAKIAGNAGTLTDLTIDLFPSNSIFLFPSHSICLSPSISLYLSFSSLSLSHYNSLYLSFSSLSLSDYNSLYLSLSLSHSISHSLSFSAYFIFFSVDIPFLTFHDLDLILFGEAISLATGIFQVRCNQVLSPPRYFLISGFFFLGRGNFIFATEFSARRM